MGKQSLRALMGYNFFYYALSAVIQFLPIYLAHIQLNGTEIGLLLGIGPFFTIVLPPLWGLLSDKLGKLKEVLLITLVFSTALGCIIFKIEGFWSIFLVLCIFYLFFAAVMPLTDSFTFRIAQTLKMGFGTIRLFGSVGFAVTSALLGLVLSKYGAGSLFFLYLTIAIFALVCLFNVKEQKEPQHKEQAAPVRMGDMILLFKSPYIRFYFMMVFFVALAHRMNDSFLALYIKSAGGSDTTAGLAWFVAAIFEAVVFSLNKYWLKEGKENQLLFFATIVYIARWWLLAWNQNPSVMVGMQVLHSLTFAVFYAAMLQQFTRLVPAQIQAAGQSALLAVFFGVSGIIGSVVGGPILQHFGGQKLYLLMGLFSLMGLITQIVLLTKSAKLIVSKKTA